MNFIESVPFTRRRPALMTDGEFEDVKKHLAEHPDAGDNIPGAGGFRKLRWANSQRNKGTRGGSRTIYLFIQLDGVIRLASIYDHEEKNDLSRDEIKALDDLATALKKQARAARDQREKALKPKKK